MQETIFSEARKSIGVQNIYGGAGIGKKMKKVLSKAVLVDGKSVLIN